MSGLSLKVPPDIVALVALAGMWALSRLGLPPFMPAPYGTVLGVALLIAGVALIVVARVALARAATTFSPIAPDRSSALVTGGVYGVSRNPIYLGMAVMLLGAAVLFGSLVCLVAVAGFVVYVDRFQILPEELVLGARFGAAYEAYAARTRRWV